jgi:hypothetical protein
MKSDEDEAFEAIERAQGWRKRQIADKVNANFDDDILCYRNELIEEIARSVENFRGAFGQDTVSSFAIYIRRMKR